MNSLTHDRKSPASVVGAVAAVALLLAGCATRTAREIPAEGKIVLTEGEYEYVYVTGSRLPVLVPTGQGRSAATQAGSRVLNRGAGALERIQNHADNVGKGR